MTATMAERQRERSTPGHPPHLMTACGHIGPYGWVNHLGHLVPIGCNRPKAHTGHHGYSTKTQPMRHTWESSDLVIHTACPKGPWETVVRIL